MIARNRYRGVRAAFLVSILALALSLVLPAQRAFARDYSIDWVDIDATIYSNGTLSVQEQRQFDFDGSFHGVYWRIPTGSYNGRQIETTITMVGEVVDGTFVPFTESYSEQDHTYQLSTTSSYVQVKLYSAHEDESAVFVIGYDDSDLATRHEDVSDLYWKFVSDGWDVESKNVTCTIHLPVPDGKVVEPEENVRAWGHGPLDASVHFNDSDVVYTVPGVGTSEFAEARITFPAEWLSEATSQGDRVLQSIMAEEQQWADEANAKRANARFITYLSTIALSLGTVGSVFGLIMAKRRYKNAHKSSFDDTYFRDVPSNDHPAILGALYRGGKPEGDDFTATLMRLTDMGVVVLDEVTLRDKGLFGRSKETKDYRLSITKRAEQQLHPIDRRALLSLFEDIGRFAPSHDSEPAGTTFYFSDLEKVAKEYPERYHDSFENWSSTVEVEMSKRQFLKGSGAGRELALGTVIFAVALIACTGAYMVLTESFGIAALLLAVQGVVLALSIVSIVGMKSYSAEAIELRAKLEALRNWLKDFTRLEEAVPRDVILWNRLLVMAVVLGVAEEVVKQLKMVAPEILDDPRLMNTYGWYYGPHGKPYSKFNDRYASAHHVSTAALAKSEASSGGGGGGGFSGGGGGGFGGGGGGGAF